MDQTSCCLFTLSGDFFNSGNFTFNLHLNTLIMKKNMGSLDKSVRVIIAVVVAMLYFTGQISGTVASILGILAIIFILTSLIGTCPLYLPFGLSTKKG